MLLLCQKNQTMLNPKICKKVTKCLYIMSTSFITIICFITKKAWNIRFFCS